MIVSYAVNPRDAGIALGTLDWAYGLDGKLPYDCILTIGKGVASDEIEAAASALFRNLTVIPSDAPDAWPQGKNDAFQNLVRHIDTHRIPEPFFWWEPDAIPLRKGWLQAIEAEHVAGNKPFTGYVNDALGLMECVGVYPPNFMEYSPSRGMLCRVAPWDRCCGQDILPQVHRANDLFQFVHDVDGFAPSFADERRVKLSDKAVLFHRNKDGTLVEQLSRGKVQRFVRSLLSREKKPEPTRELITVVMPVCARDITQAIRHAQWLKQLGGPAKHAAVIAYDLECPADRLRELFQICATVFRSVQLFLYPEPNVRTYPAVANWAFARVVEFMSHGTAPWLWLEADCCVLRADWLDVLQKEYEACGKKFMGPIVKEAGFGHVNGTSVYPADALVRIPRALTAQGVAWDFAMKPEMIGDCHDASHIIQNIWGLVNGLPSQTNGTVPPTNFTLDLARKVVRPDAVLLHRVKDNSLTDLLMAGGWR